MSGSGNGSWKFYCVVPCLVLLVVFSGSSYASAAPTAEQSAIIAEQTKHIEANPKDYKAYFRRARAYSDCKMYEESESDCLKGLSLNSKFQYLWILHADNCFMTKDYLRSLEAVREAQRVGPYRVLMAGLEAANLSLLSRDQDCFEFCDREIKLHPELAALYYFRGISGHKLHMEPRQVLADLEKAVQLAPAEVNYANALRRVSGGNSGRGKH